jgi:uncharacterized protein (TIGR03000 family)
MKCKLLALPLALFTLTWLLLPEAAHSQEKDKDKSGKQPAYLKLILPQDNTEVTIDETKTRQFGKNRLFVSPPLEPGKRYSYKVVAVWAPNNYTTITRTRTATVEGGKETVLDMTVKDEKIPDNVIVRYVPTPRAVVDKMLEMAKVGKDDVVYDLGCGDGRLVITAVEKFGAKRGVGIDYDPERIKDSNANAKKAGVTDKVEFKQANVLHLKDFSEASVVTLYMGLDLNIAVRPVLWSTLKPGSRVVSHRFLMGDDYPPLKTETLTLKNDYGDDEEFKLHLWIIGKKKDGE